jgi:hypothetical protein
VAVVSGEVWTMLGWNGLAAVLVLVNVWAWLNRGRR